MRRYGTYWKLESAFKIQVINEIRKDDLGNLGIGRRILLN
jgi:hypothetical protein